MGSKNLKAVSARDTGKIAVRDPKAFHSAVLSARSELDASEDIQALIDWGTANAVGFAMEAAEKDLLQAPEEIRLEFGDVEAAEDLIRALAFRQGELGELLARGVHRASEQLGEPSRAFAQHVKGLESPAYGPIAKARVIRPGLS